MIPHGAELSSTGARKHWPHRLVAGAAMSLAVVGVFGVAAASRYAASRSSQLPATISGGTIASSVLSHAVPWVDRPAGRAAVDGRVSRMSAPPPCRPGQLQARLGNQGAWLGFATQGVEVTNVSSQACSFSSRVSVAGAGRGGAAGQFAASPPKPITIEAGRYAFMMLQAAGTCRGAGRTNDPILSAFTVALGGATQRLDGGRLDIVCGLLHAEFIPVDNPPPMPSLARPNTVKAQYAGPQEVARGTTLKFAITLIASAGRVPSYHACPVYTMVLTQFPRLVSKSYVLNCHPRGATTSRATVYAMQFDVPADLRPGDVKFSWSLDGGVFSPHTLKLT